jgi:hypothetical protein
MLLNKSIGLFEMLIDWIILMVLDINKLKLWLLAFIEKGIQIAA